MIREENWDIRLFHWGNSVVGKPFRWGVTDCASLVIDAMEVMYGVDVFPGVERWRSLRKAVRVLRDVGSLGDFFEDSGGVQVPLAFAQSGDIVLASGLDNDNLPRMGVICNGTVIYSKRDRGVVCCRISDLEKGTQLWRLPNG
jgi:hypothetical protein